MNKNLRVLFIFWSSLILIIQACNPIAPQATPTSPAPTATQSPTKSPTAISKPTNTPATNVTVANTEEVQCTTLQDVNLRTGPGLAYRNPIGVVLADTDVEPLGFVSEGIPGGPWIMIKTDGADQEGWITAGEPYLDCNVDLNSLPEVDVVPPPPPPLPETAQTTDPEGGCGPDQDYQCEVIITDESFLQFKIYQDGKELTENDNVIQVSFNVRQGTRDDDGAEVYSIVEGVSAYCILGGNGPCNNWPLEDNVTVWPDGPAVIPGTYFIEILATVDENGDENDIRWAAEFEITLP